MQVTMPMNSSLKNMDCLQSIFQDGSPVMNVSVQ